METFYCLILEGVIEKNRCQNTIDSHCDRCEYRKHKTGNKTKNVETGPAEKEARAFYDGLSELVPSFREHCKNNPVIPSSTIRRSTVKKRRTKTHSITVEGYLEDMKLEVTASPEDWQKLAQYLEEDAERFGLDFWNPFIYPDLEECKDGGPRGRHRHTERIVQEIKMRAGILYAFFLYWCGQPPKIWPDYLGRLIEKARKVGQSLAKKDGTMDPLELTVFSLTSLYAPFLQPALTQERLQRRICKKVVSPTGLAINPFENQDSFRVTYVEAHIDASLYRKHRDYFQDMPEDTIPTIPTFFTTVFLRGKTPEEVTKLAYDVPALKKVFTSLGLFPTRV